MILITNSNSAVILKPGKQALNLPAAFIPTKATAILRCWFNTVFFMRRNQFYTLSSKALIQRIAVIRLISNQLFRGFSYVFSLKCFFRKSDFMRASTGHVHRDRKTRAVCHCHEFRTFAPLGLSHVEAPFFASMNVPSMKHSVKSRLPRWRRSSANARNTLAHVPSLTHFWKRLWHVWYGGYRSGISCHGAPVRNIHKIPLKTALVSFQGRPRPSDRLGSFGINGSIIAHCSSFKSINSPPLLIF